MIRACLLEVLAEELREDWMKKLIFARDPPHLIPLILHGHTHIQKSIIINVESE